MIRVIVAREGDFWVAQCLEYDIGAQARDLDELRRRLQMAIQAEHDESMKRYGRAFAGIGQAPPYFHEQWDRRAGDFTPTHSSAVHDGADINIEYGMAA
jgi:hypothetical protein